MSAVNTSLSDRDHEALRRAQRSHEPSMEEILASIRTIIAEERDPARSEPKGGAAKPAVSGPQIVYSKAEDAAPRVAAPPPPRPMEPPPPPSVSPKPEPEANTVAIEVPPAEDHDPLLSPATETAVASAFDALSAKLAARSAELAEGVAREMLRPMLKTWLDENLPGIVERLVQAEIERVVRGR